MGLNEKDVPRGTRINDLQRHDSQRNIDSSFDRSTGNSTKQNGIVDGVITSEEPSTEQESQSDGLGTAHEQPKKRSRKNRNDENHLSLI